MKKLYKGNFEFDCICTRGYWFWKKEVKEIARINTNLIFLCETEDGAKVKFIESSQCWLYDAVPFYSWKNWDDPPRQYTIIGKRVFVKELKTHTFDELKKNMNTDEFLEYCKQELVDPIKS
jgi:hypothetical protein